MSSVENKAKQNAEKSWKKVGELVDTMKGQFESAISDAQETFAKMIKHSQRWF